MDSEKVLRAEQLCWGVPAALKAGDPPIIKDLDFSLDAGEWVALTGPSGVGKTTFLSLCAGLLRPSAGSINLFGLSVPGARDAELSRLRAERMGLVFQNYHLDDSRSAEENILLPGYFGHHNWHDLKERAAALGERLGLREHLNKPASVLSGGQRQRVALARALIGSPSLILADEPTGALDKDTAESVLAMLSQEVERGVAVVSVTHDPAVIEKAHRCCSFVGGRVVEAPV